MVPGKTRVAIVSIGYGVEISPVAKNLASYLRDHQYLVDIIVDNLYVNQDFNIEGVTLVNYSTPLLISKLKGIKRRVIHRIKELTVLYRLKLALPRYKWVICVEAYSLIYVSQSGCSTSKIIYYFLENTQIIASLDKSGLLAGKLKDIPWYLIPSIEREQSVLKKLKLNGTFIHLPVSLRPQEERNEIINESVTLIHSGYFASWTFLFEFTDEVTKRDNSGLFELVLHGHAVGTELYLNQITSLILDRKRQSNVSINLEHLADVDHIKYLRSFNIGIALYKQDSDDDNWQDLMFSSGKIATYLWAGLPVITNIRNSYTNKEPFLFINEITFDNIQIAVELYKSNRLGYHQAAYQFARIHYNFDKYASALLVIL